MELSKQEKQILSALDDIPADDVFRIVNKFTKLSEPIINDTTEKFLKEGFIEKISIPQADTERDWYFHTSKVMDNMLDDNIRYKMHWGIYPLEEISYPIEEENEEDRIIVIKVGKRWLENRVLKYEGFKLKIPKEVRDYEKIVFAVMNIEKGKEIDTFDIWLHAHNGPLPEDLDEPYTVTPRSVCYIDAGGDIETKLTISKEVLKKWARLKGENIDNAFRNLNVGDTYNLLLNLPRTITLSKYKVIVFRNLNQPIDHYNVCRLLLDNKHPLDSKISNN